jgi:hypothetical protein
MAFVTVDGCRKMLKQVWRPKVGHERFDRIRYSQLAKIADDYQWGKKTVSSSARCAARSSTAIATFPRSTTLPRR